MVELIERTLGQILTDTASEQPDREALVYSDRGLRYTYSQFEEHCKTVAKGLMSFGIEKGEHLSIWASNIPEWVSTQFASAKVGAVLVTVNTNYRSAELRYLLEQSDTTTLLLMDEYKGTSYIDTLYEIVPELKTSVPGELYSEVLPHLRRVIYLGEERYPGMYNWTDLLEHATRVSNDALQRRMDTLQPDEVINMQYTSGTTGFPKGVMLTHRNIVNNGYNVANRMQLGVDDRLCIPVPFFHCFGCVMSTIACVTTGATMVPIQEFDPKVVLRTVEKEKCTALHGVPTMFIAEMNVEGFETYDLSTLRTGLWAGSNCPIEVMKGVVDKMGLREMTIAYGQTEASPVCTQTQVDDPLQLRVETVGRALANVEVKIVQPGTEEEVPRGEQGEFCTRGYHVMRGYYNNQEATDAVLQPDGWLHTGDLAVMDDNGYCKITGRLKDMIIRGGENIYPREIEEFLYTHPAIQDVQVVGVPDEKYGEVVSAWVLLKPHTSLTEDELKSYCFNKISRFKVPRDVYFVDEYPMTASGKIQKYKLREQAIAKSQEQKS
ncbi:LOW QUALITY PROTEIN: long-chain-fatty-acid-CoA ligase [Geomicrobium sp. JCM 19038]|nr:LOW QUALITY PROTEIN: long-chain-fatty-acid-CoA ligase [Geomicrobium sp. JCM 19038]